MTQEQIIEGNTEVRVFTTRQLQIGSVTNKGIVDKIFDNKNISIDGQLYDLGKHKITIKTTTLNKTP